MEYLFAMINVQRYYAGEETELVPNTFNKVMALPAMTFWNAASDEKVVSLKKNNVFTFVHATTVLRRCMSFVGDGTGVNSASGAGATIAVEARVAKNFLASTGTTTV